MSETDFMTVQRNAEVYPLSPFAIFCLELKGHKFFRRGFPIYKYQLWELGYRNTANLLNNETVIICKPSDNPSEEPEEPCV